MVCTGWNESECGVKLEDWSAMEVGPARAESVRTKKGSMNGAKLSTIVRTPGTCALLHLHLTFLDELSHLVAGSHSQSLPRPPRLVKVRQEKKILRAIRMKRLVRSILCRRSWQSQLVTVRVSSSGAVQSVSMLTYLHVDLPESPSQAPQRLRFFRAAV